MSTEEEVHQELRQIRESIEALTALVQGLIEALAYPDRPELGELIQLPPRPEGGE